jgi:hypothetical protein
MLTERKKFTENDFRYMKYAKQRGTVVSHLGDISELTGPEIGRGSDIHGSPPAPAGSCQ